MKRLYTTIGLVILCLIFGIVEITTVNYTSDKCLSNLEQIDNEIDKGNFKEAEKLCKKTADEYKNITNTIIYCYYPHRELSSINQNLSIMKTTIKNKDLKEYKIYWQTIKEQLHTIKDGELISIQNIL